MTENKTQSTGQFLRELREKKQCTLEQVAYATKIKVEHLEAIESDEIVTRVPVIYARGFVKAYAEFLGADSTLIVQRFKKEYSPSSSEMTVQPTSPVAKHEKKELPGILSWKLILPAAAMLVTFLLFLIISAASRPYKVTVKATGRVPMKVYEDGQFVWGATLGPGTSRSWNAKRSIQLKIARPENAQVFYRGRKIGLPKKWMVSLVFDRRGVRKTLMPRPLPPEREQR
jgi:transcriptional regulator with XRE-family HTH domain